MRRAARLIGRVLLGLGCVVLLFTLYELWGTSLVETHAQARLRAELSPSLALTRPRPVATSRIPMAAQGPVTAVEVPPPARGRPIGIIRIPAIGVDQVIVEGVGAAQLESGPGHYPGTPLPGQAGNAVIAGHRTTYAHPFYSLDQVHPGDFIDVTTPQGAFVYQAYGTDIVAPTDVAVLDDTADPELTLTTCNPRYSAASRLVLHARLVHSSLGGVMGRSTSVVAPGGPAAAATEGGRSTPRDAVRTAGAGARARARAAASGGSDAGDGGAGSWFAASAWLLACASVFLFTRWLARRHPHPWRWWVGGTLPFLVALFLCFGALTPLLPAGL